MTDYCFGCTCGECIGYEEGRLAGIIAALEAVKESYSSVDVVSIIRSLLAEDGETDDE